jgi:hypothetical protein
MDFLRRLFAPPQPPWVLTSLPGLSYVEYLRAAHLRARYWKYQRRASFEYAHAKAEARVVQWAYEASRAGHSSQLLATRVMDFRGWPGRAEAWRNAAVYLLQHLTGVP